MNKVTDIKKLRNHQYLISLVIDGKEQKIIVVEDTLLRCNILSPREITNSEYKLLTKNKDVDLLYQKSIKFVDYQMRTISEVKKHLRKSTPDEKIIEKIIIKLKQQGFLDDYRYANEYITQKLEFDILGPRAIKQKLITKGIHYDLIDAELIRYTDEIQYNKVYELIQKETKHPIKKPYIKAVDSIKRKCVNKGFSLAIIDSSIQSYRDVIQEACDEDGLLEVEFHKLKKGVDLSDYSEKDKLIKKLMQKGFSYQNIKKIIQLG